MKKPKLPWSVKVHCAAAGERRRSDRPQPVIGCFRKVELTPDMFFFMKHGDDYYTMTATCPHCGHNWDPMWEISEKKINELVQLFNTDPSLREKQQQRWQDMLNSVKNKDKQ